MFESTHKSEHFLAVSSRTMDVDSLADSQSFDISGTSVSILQGFLDATEVLSIDHAIEIFRSYCPGCSRQHAHNALVANKWEVAQIHIAGFTNEDLKAAIRIFTAEHPYPFYKWVNAPFFSKVPCKCSACYPCGCVAVFLCFLCSVETYLPSATMPPMLNCC